MKQLVLDPAPELTAADAEWLRKQTAAILRLFHRTAEMIVETGLILIDVKERLGQGFFMAWIEKGSIPNLKYRTAHRYVQVAEAFAPDGTWICQIGNFEPTALYVLADPQTPDAARELAIELAIKGRKITHAAACNIIKEANAVEPDSSSAQQPGTSRVQSNDRAIGAEFQTLLDELDVEDHLIFAKVLDPDGDPIIKVVFEGSGEQ